LYREERDAEAVYERKRDDGLVLAKVTVTQCATYFRVRLEKRVMTKDTQHT
jgi:hypothetical protein